MKKTLKKNLIKLKPENRLYHVQMPIIGLTGGIATGKSTVTKILESKGFKIIDADQMVKSIYQTQEAKDFIRDHFSRAWVNDQISFPLLREIFFNNSEAKVSIENFIYHRLPGLFQQSIAQHTDQAFCVYDVPLLFEKNLDKQMDFTVVVYAPRELQIQRLIQRDQISPESAEIILNQQIDIEQKNNKADYVINNSGTFEEVAVEVDRLLLLLLN